MATATARNGRARGARVDIAPAPPELPDGSSLAAAVLRVQAAAPKLVTNEDGQIQNRTYRYVTNDALVDAVLPLLVTEELLWRTFPTTLEDGAPALRYRMTHVPSGESDEDVMNLACIRDPQGQGSGITYARRYALTAYLNLTIDPDDDGASAQPQRDKYAEAEAASQGGPRVDPGTTRVPTAEPAKPTERTFTANQRSKLLVPRAKKAGLSDGQFANVLLVAAGEQPREWKDEGHASQTLKRLLDRCPARLKDAVLEGIDAAGKAAKA